MGKGEEEDLNIDDCYVPQRSIYDTVRLNEQIDSSSKGSLASRHFTGTLPYTQRTLDFSSLCGNGVMSASSSFELRTQKAAMDERAVFDGLRLNGNIIRATDTVLPKSRLHEGEKKDAPHYRRSWRAFAPTHLGQYVSRSGTLCSGSVDRPGLINGRRGQSMTSSLTSEEDSGLYSPTVDRDRHAQRPHKRVGPGTRSLSSSEAMHMSAELKPGRSLSSGQEDFLYSPARDSVSLYTCNSLVQDRKQAKSGFVDVKWRNRYSTGSASRVQNESLSWRSKKDYEEESTAELLEDVPSAEDCELVSVVVTQPEYGNSVTLPMETRQWTKTCHTQVAASKYSLEELEEFLQSVEACLPKCLEELQQAGEHEIEFFLNAIAACSDIELTGSPCPQVHIITTLFGFEIYLSLD